MSGHYSAQQRRALNQVWNAAGVYGFSPLFLSLDRSGGLYLNTIVGCVRKWYGEEKPAALFQSWAGDRRQALLDNLAWLALESAAYTRELPARPLLAELRRAHGEDFFAREQSLSRQEWMAKNQLSYTMQAARWRAVLGRRPPMMTPYEKHLSAALGQRLAAFLRRLSMFMKPIPLGRETLAPAELTADRKDCRRFGLCGAGKRALYLNSFYLDCRYYIPYVEYGGGKQKQCNFKYEDKVDQLLEYLSKLRPSIPRLSAEGEARLAKREQERSAKVLPELTEQADRSVKLLQKAEDYLKERPDLTGELSRSAREKRAYLRSKPAYRYVALAVMAAGLAALVYGIYALTQGAGTALYFLLFGLAALFMFSGANVLPTSRNNRKAVFRRAEAAQAALEAYLQGFPKFPLPSRYAHPVVLRRMRRAVEEGRADLRALNSSVEVDQEEYDEVVAIKPMFLNEDYQ